MDSFLERQARFVVDRINLEGHLRTVLEKMLDVRRGERLGHVVTVEDDLEFTIKSEATLGSYVVEVIKRVDRDTERTLWVTLHHGVCDVHRWNTIEQALIHLIAQRKNASDAGNQLVTFVSRAIGFDDWKE